MNDTIGPSFRFCPASSEPREAEVPFRIFCNLLAALRAQKREQDRVAAASHPTWRCLLIDGSSHGSQWGLRQPPQVIGLVEMPITLANGGIFAVGCLTENTRCGYAPR